MRPVGDGSELTDDSGIVSEFTEKAHGRSEKGSVVPVSRARRLQLTKIQRSVLNTRHLSFLVDRTLAAATATMFPATTAKLRTLQGELLRCRNQILG